MSARDRRMRQVQISTVDGFQGEEKDLIIISTVRTCESVGFLKDERRINVAVTRPRHHLFLFGHTDILRGSNSDFAHLLPHYDSEENSDCVVTDYKPASLQL